MIRSWNVSERFLVVRAQLSRPAPLAVSKRCKRSDRAQTRMQIQATQVVPWPGTTLRRTCDLKIPSRRTRCFLRGWDVSLQWTNAIQIWIKMLPLRLAASMGRQHLERAARTVVLKRSKIHTLAPTSDAWCPGPPPRAASLTRPICSLWEARTPQLASSDPWRGQRVDRPSSMPPHPCSTSSSRTRTSRVITGVSIPSTTAARAPN